MVRETELGDTPSAFFFVAVVDAARRRRRRRRIPRAKCICAIEHVSSYV